MVLRWLVLMVKTICIGKMHYTRTLILFSIITVHFFLKVVINA